MYVSKVASQNSESRETYFTLIMQRTPNRDLDLKLILCMYVVIYMWAI